MGGSDILSGPSGTANRISQLLPGEGFAVVESSGAWAWGYSAHDHYVGYVPSHALTGPSEATHIVEGRSTLAFAEPSSRAAVRALLPMGARITGERDGDFLASESGYVPLQHVRPLDRSGGDPVDFAERLIGTPYLWGGRGLGGIDCSGLVQLAFGLAGLSLPRDSDQQAATGSAVHGPLERGDLLFFPDHVVLLSAPDRAIHASGHWMSTIAEPLADIVRRLGEPVAQRRMTS